MKALQRLTLNLSKAVLGRPLATLCCLLALVVVSTIAVGQKSGPQKSKGSDSATKPSPSPTRSRSIADIIGEPPPYPSPSPTPIEISPGDVISVTTTEVMLPVTVRDSQGRFANNLDRSDFRVYEDGKPQPLSDLALRQIPVDVVLMVDASSSVASNLDDFRRAAEGFAAKLAPDDRISLIKFDDRVQLLQDWTKSRFQLRRALARIEPGMFTRFNDALLLASRQQFVESTSRRALILLSDGIDSGRGTTSGAAMLSALLDAQVVVYVVSNTEIVRGTKRAELDSLMGGTDASVRFNQIRINNLKLGLEVLDRSEEQLEQIAEATGGRLYKPLSFGALDATYAEVAEELRNQYALYYLPLNKARDGSFRRVKIEMVNPDFKARTRIGYFAPKR